MNWVLQNQNKGKQGLGFKKPLPLYNPKSKYVGLSCNMLCTFFGKIGHYKASCTIAAKAKNKNKRAAFPLWARKDLIHPFSYKKGPKLVWVNKSNP